MSKSKINEAWRDRYDAKMIVDFLDVEEAAGLVLTMKTEVIDGFKNAKPGIQSYKVSPKFKNAWHKLADMIDYAIEEHRDETSLTPDSTRNEIKYNEYFATQRDVIKCIVQEDVFKDYEFDKYGNLVTFVTRVGFYEDEYVIFYVDIKSGIVSLDYKFRDDIEYTYTTNSGLLDTIENNGNARYMGQGKAKTESVKPQSVNESVINLNVKNMFNSFDVESFNKWLKKEVENGGGTYNLKNYPFAFLGAIELLESSNRDFVIDDFEINSSGATIYCWYKDPEVGFDINIEFYPSQLTITITD